MINKEYISTVNSEILLQYLKATVIDVARIPPKHKLKPFNRSTKEPSIIDAI
tara:strand:- start:384 stop:539 length:156 start_codon:yes stop_codon:yes gene_type:complete